MTSITVICAFWLFAHYVLRPLLRRIFSVLDNIPGPPRKSLLTGNLTQYFDPDGWEFQRELEENYGGVVKLHGLCGDRDLYVSDLAALQSILIKDQDLYEEQTHMLSARSLLLGKGIFSTSHEDHRRLRKIMLPAFSTANLRPIVPIFYEVAEQARDSLIAPNVREGPRMLDVFQVFSRLSLELIGRTGIGLSLDSMVLGADQTNQYAQALQELLPTSSKLALLMPFCPFIVRMPFPGFRRLMINLLPLPALHHLRDVVDITDAAATQLVAERKAKIQSGAISLKDDAKDIMSLLMKSNLSAKGALRLTDEELVGSTASIILAASDTTSAALNRIFQILALHPEVQNTLRAEILAAPEHMDHDELVALPYMDAFVRELLRLYPPVTPAAVTRETCKETVLPLRAPLVGVDGTLLHSITVPKGTSVYIGIAAVNHSKQIWGADALEFKPERWTKGKAQAAMQTSGVYGNMMTFGGGGHSCIGFKFSQLEIKTVLCVFLRAFTFSAPDKRVKWRMTGPIQSPSVEGRPGLPILVERRTAQ